MAKMLLTLEGDELLVKAIETLVDRLENEAELAMQESVDMVRNRAIEGITSPPKTGRIYTHRYPFVFGNEDRADPSDRRPKPHQASAPGEYPAGDTGNLMRSIFAEVERDFSAAFSGVDLGMKLEFQAQGFTFSDGNAEIRGFVGAHADYAAPLEYKPPEKGGRPFLRRAFAEMQDDIVKRFEAIFDRVER